jgi:hypothetical protein
MCRPLAIAIAFAVLSASEPAAVGADPKCLDRLFAASDSWLGGETASRILQARSAARAEPLETDRPDFTEASSVVGLGIVQMESGYTFAYRDDERDGSITKTHSAPEFLWRIGIHDDVELRFVWNYLWERSRLGSAVSSPEGGEGFTFGAKFALLEEQGFVPETALILDCTFESGAKEFRTEDLDLGSNLLYSWTLPQDWSLAGSTGFSSTTEDVPVAGGLLTDRDGHVVMHQSASIGVPLADAVGMYLEYFGLYTFGRNSNFPENYVDGGFTFLLSNDIQLDARAGKGLNDHATDFFSGVGLSVRF